MATKSGMKSGGWSDPKEATTEIQFISALFREEVRTRLKVENLRFYKAVEFRTQVVNGINYEIKVAAGPTVVNLQIHSPPRQNQGNVMFSYELTGFQIATLEETFQK